MTIYHIIGAGYEGNSTYGIVEGAEADIEALYEEFLGCFGLFHETDIFNIKNERELRRQMNIQWWILSDMVARGYGEHSAEHMFVEWLIRERGYKRIEAVVVDIGDDFLDVRRERKLKDK